MKRILAALAALFLLASCATISGPGSAPKPKLVVFLVVDGFPQRQVVDYRDQLAPTVSAALSTAARGSRTPIRALLHDTARATRPC